jgi:hypothetical protein
MEALTHHIPEGTEAGNDVSVRIGDSTNILKSYVKKHRSKYFGNRYFNASINHYKILVVEPKAKLCRFQISRLNMALNKF